MKKIPHITFLLISIAVLAITILLYAYLHYSIQASASRAILGRQTVRTEEVNIGQVRTAEKIYSKTVMDRKRISSFFISSKNAISFIESIEKLGSYAGSKATISGVSADEVDSLPDGSFAKISAHIEATGSWASILRTLRLSETLPYQVSISSVSLGGTGQAWGISYNIVSNMIVEKNATTTSTK